MPKAAFMLLLVDVSVVHLHGVKPVLFHLDTPVCSSSGWLASGQTRSAMRTINVMWRKLPGQFITSAIVNKHKT